MASENWRDNLEVTAQTSVGMRRSNNQDSHRVALAGNYDAWTHRGHVFMVADGMGAHAAGELASKLAVDNVPHTYNKQPDLPAPAAINKAIVDANALIHGRGQADAGFQGMGTTCSTLILLPEGALVAHVGDSRVYRLRQNVLEQLTFDHSLIWEMVASGQVQSEAAAGFVPKNVITRSLGPNAQVKVDLEGPLPIEIGDTYLLCSDGLTGPVKDEEIGAMLGSLPVEEAVQTLIDLANLRGGPDNITVVAVRIKGPLDGANERKPSDRAAAPVHPALWIGAVMLLMVALVLAVVGAPWWAPTASIVGAVVVGLIGLLQRSGTGGGGRSAIGGPFGKGPHRRYDVRPSQTLVEGFADTVRRLAEAAKRDGLPLDWPQFEGHQQAAQQAATAENYPAALAHSSRAIRAVTLELHKVRGR